MNFYATLLQICLKILNNNNNNKKIILIIIIIITINYDNNKL